MSNNKDTLENYYESKKGIHSQAVYHSIMVYFI